MKKTLYLITAMLLLLNSNLFAAIKMYSVSTGKLSQQLSPAKENGFVDGDQLLFTGSAKLQADLPTGESTHTYNVDQIIFKSTNGVLDIDKNVTIKFGRMGYPSDRATSWKGTIQGEGTLVFTSQTLNFQPATGTQTYNLLQSSTFDMSGKTIQVGTMNVVKMQNVKMSDSSSIYVGEAATSNATSLDINFKGDDKNVASVGVIDVGKNAKFTSDFNGTLYISAFASREGSTFEMTNASANVYYTSSTLANVKSAVLGKNAWTVGTFNISATTEEAVRVRKILPTAGSKVILGSKNVVKYNSGYIDSDTGDEITSKIASCYTGATVELQADQIMGDLLMSAASAGDGHSDLTIDFNGFTFMFDGFENEPKKDRETTYSLYFTDFTNGNFKLKDTSRLDLDCITVNGDKSLVLKWSDVADANGYYSLQVVPEPSTYAAIFGAIALGFVVYRRRK